MAEIAIEIDRKGKHFMAEIVGDIKFYADTFIFENDDLFLLMNGVNLSFSTSNKQENIKHCIEQYKTIGECFFKSFRGSFCGALFDKKANKWIVFTNQIGDQKLFYSQTSDSIIISSDIFRIIEELKTRKESYSLCLNAAYSLLSYGYMTDSSTLVKEISRLTAGEYFTFEKGELNLKKYYTLDNTPNYKLSEQDCIEQIDVLFRKAIQLEFDKDIQYGYKHIASMSGGLDCRMTNFVAYEMGYREVTNITFSQYGYLDMTIAHEMSTYLGYEWLFKALDNGNFLKDIDEMVRRTNAVILYSGSAHANNMMNMINFSNYGVLHSGQLGDVVISSFSRKNTENQQKLKASSSKYTSKVKDNFSRFANNNERANFYLRAFNGALSGNFLAQIHTEVSSPFVDIEFLNFCMSIPIEYREQHKIYKKWILQKYPDAANFKWESINAKVSDKTVPFRGKRVPLKQFPKYLMDGIRYHIGKDARLSSKRGMNPYDYWYKTNQQLKEYLQTYFDTHINLIEDKELMHDSKALFLGGTTIEKSQVLTLLSAIKQLEL
nr:asparagine synthase-related protein [uncultured Draconibacterium sp.]